jgi:hypothetical protein
MLGVLLDLLHQALVERLPGDREVLLALGVERELPLGAVVAPRGLLGSR